MNVWFDLELRFFKNKEIDKDVQVKISKEKEQWINVLKRIIDMVKVLAKNNLTFHETNKKICV